MSEELKAKVTYCNEMKELKMPKTFDKFKTLFIETFTSNQIQSVDFNLFELYYEDKEKQNMRVFIKTQKDYENTLKNIKNKSVIYKNTLYVKDNQFGINYPLTFEDRIKMIIELQVEEAKEAIRKRLLNEEELNNEDVYAYKCQKCNTKKNISHKYKCVICEKEMCNSCSESHDKNHPLLQIPLENIINNPI